MSKVQYLIGQIESAANSFNTYSDKKDDYAEQFMKASSEMFKILIDEVEALKKVQLESEKR